MNINSDELISIISFLSGRIGGYNDDKFDEERDSIIADTFDFLHSIRVMKANELKDKDVNPVIKAGNGDSC